jgi:hypothetical protein
LGQMVRLYAYLHNSPSVQSVLTEVNSGAPRKEAPLRN